jgi:hypothetical protein
LSNLPKDPLKTLCVIDRLVVGPVRLERKRLKMPYTVIRGGRRDTIELIYRYEQDVFGPDNPQSRNLASMIGVQVALNYGLFCREMAFIGPFDRNDRKFITDMAENTAREIYIKKFLEPNPFLTRKAAELPAIKKNSYLYSKIIFDDGNDTLNKSKFDDKWESDRPAYAVLSSGGKDSLLSFGLLNELGEYVVPIFVNESGRHWYTALNAYRYFNGHVSGTARVWTNADRLFNWMLRHLPFVRQDFARFRADEYPIRLWTVAVFLFGALPLMRIRGLNRLVIGDEYDTSRKMYHNGILHYDGLYDQSRYFDNAMSSYYKRKRWGIKQFSIIRQLSEVIIEKILVERYPDLQKQQVSCHATHVERGRIYPCGDCEKCRRIVGMLVALDADPTRCGYNSRQIKNILRELAHTRLRQDADTAGQTLYLLSQKGMVPSEKPSKIRSHPQIMKIMIDKDKSPVGEIPDDLRKRLFSIYLEHTEGAAERLGKTWLDIGALAQGRRSAITD